MVNKLITIFSLILGILGFIATFIGTYLTYISIVNPIIRFNKFLKNKNGWEKFIGVESNLYYYRYKRYPSFQIVIDWDNPVVENFHEEWMNETLSFDKTNSDSHLVRFEVNGMLLDKELFVSIDGHRWFVPVPKVKASKEYERSFYYDMRQIYLANIIGKYYYEETDIYSFAKTQKKPIDIKKY